MASLQELLTNLASAVRSKSGNSARLTIAEMIDIINSLSIGTDIDLSDLVAENIKYGITINGVSGTFTEDADATGTDIAEGMTAYVKGEPVSGSLADYRGSTDPIKTVSSVEEVLNGLSITDRDSIYGPSNYIKLIGLDNLVPANIKKGITILGVTGTLTSESAPDVAYIESVLYTPDAYGSEYAESANVYINDSLTITGTTDSDGVYVLDEYTKTWSK